mmetsp:Transcript_16710/g.39341  ORF Transcript_16710/g.39341 Transcript_16710/m.39341 type:complete len:798 (+) Transcript_16710:123-2516(+)|eukprot:CAMPEP_0114555842 /NCGR_PEP_ID=MMETSP0114-20121206/8966_1 /TAXON_ID=31324 /ORGANISM="Goniomonas sp, Strain m" /LENGTH=797 /DNA_ID=CAMNT_0001740997 /DNA_START=28 /DNA_END=2421 /DNA_ORIENTATION=+
MTAMLGARQGSFGSSSAQSFPLNGASPNSRQARLKTLAFPEPRTEQPPTSLPTAAPPSRVRPHSAGVFRSTVSFKERGEKENSQGPQNDSGPGRGLYEGAPETSTASLGQGRVRPSSAMARMGTRPTGAPQSEHAEFETLKKDIMVLIKSLNRSTKENQDCEGLLRRYVFSAEASQVLVAKTSLLTLLLEKQEEVQRYALEETQPSGRKEHRGRNAWGDTTPRVNTVLNLCERARSLRKSLEVREEENLELMTLVEGHKAENKRLTEEASLLKMTLMDAAQQQGSLSSRSLMRKLQRDIASASEDSQRLAEATQKLQEAEKANDELRKSLSHMSDQIDSLKAALARRERPQAVKQDDGALQELEEQVASLNETLAELRADLRNEKTSNSNLQNKVKAADAEAAKAKAAGAKEKEAAEAKAKGLEGQLKTTNTELAEVKSTLATLRQSGAGASAKEKDLLKQIEKASKQISALENEVAKLKSEIKRMGEGEGGLKGQLADMTAAEDASRKQAEKLQRDKDRVTSEAAAERLAAEERIAALQKEVADGVARLRAAQAAAADGAGMADTVNQLQNQLENMTHLRDLAEDKVVQSHKELEDCKHELGHRIRELQARYLDLEGKLEAEKKGSKEMKESAEEMRAKWQEAQRSLDEARRENTKLKSDSASASELAKQLAKSEQGRAKAESDAKAASSKVSGAENDMKLAIQDKIDIETKMRALLERCELLENKVIQEEKMREEVRDAERMYKARMKEMYELRIQELEANKKDFEDNLRAQLAATKSDSTGAARPHTAAATRRR